MMRLVRLIILSWGAGIAAAFAGLAPIVGIRRAGEAIGDSLIFSLAGFAILAFAILLPILLLLRRTRWRNSALAGAGAAAVPAILATVVLLQWYGGATLSRDAAFLAVLIAVPAACFGWGFRRVGLGR